MDSSQIIIIGILLISLLTILGIAVGAFLASWPVTNQLSKTIKRLIIATATLLILVFLVFLAKWSDIKISGSTGALGIDQTAMPNS